MTIYTDTEMLAAYEPDEPDSPARRSYLVKYNITYVTCKCYVISGENDTMHHGIHARLGLKYGTLGWNMSI